MPNANAPVDMIVAAMKDRARAGWSLAQIAEHFATPEDVVLVLIGGVN